MTTIEAPSFAEAWTDHLLAPGRPLACRTDRVAELAADLASCAPGDPTPVSLVVVLGLARVLVPGSRRLAGAEGAVVLLVGWPLGELREDPERLAVRCARLEEAVGVLGVALWVAERVERGAYLWAWQRAEAWWEDDDPRGPEQARAPERRKREDTP